MAWTLPNVTSGHYARFLKSLRGGPSKEVAVQARLVSRDIQTTTGTNIRVVEEASGLSICY